MNRWARAPAGEHGTTLPDARAGILERINEIMRPTAGRGMIGNG